VSRRGRLGAAIVSLGATATLVPACGGVYPQPLTCGAENTNALILMAQAVPSATLVPCIAEFPAGWSYDGSRIGSGSAQFWLDSDRAGFRALEVTLTESCDVSNAVEVTTGAGVVPGARVYEEPISLAPTFQVNRYLLFPGGCVTNKFRFTTGASATLALEAQQALSFVSRSVLVEQAKEDTGLSLCGAEAPHCPG
jgi:hypothetical protein